VGRSNIKITGELKMANIVPLTEAFRPIALVGALADKFKSNLGGGEALPKISIKGKVWTIVKEGERNVLMDADGNAEPSIEVVVLAQTASPDGRPSRTRSYFEGVYDPDSSTAPVCASYDGYKPSADSSNPQSEKCESCPKSVKGSHKDGIRSACQTGKRLVVVPSNDLSTDSFYLQLPITSVWVEKEEHSDKGWFSWDGYMKHLKARGVQHTATVTTKMRFVPGSQYPQVVFKATNALTEEGLNIVAERIDSDEVKKLLGVDRGYATRVGEAVEEDELDETPVATKAKVAPKVEDDFDEPAPKPKAKVEDDFDEPAPKPKAKVEDDFDEPAPKPKAKVAEPEEPAPKPKVANSSAELLAELDDWD
jgi:hypothetical protein